MKCGRNFFFVVHFSSKTLPHYNKVGLFGWLYVCDNKGNICRIYEWILVGSKCACACYNFDLNLFPII